MSRPVLGRSEEGFLVAGPPRSSADAFHQREVDPRSARYKWAATDKWQIGANNADIDRQVAGAGSPAAGRHPSHSRKLFNTPLLFSSSHPRINAISECGGPRWQDHQQQQQNISRGRFAARHRPCQRIAQQQAGRTSKSPPPGSDPQIGFRNRADRRSASKEVAEVRRA